MMTQAESLKLLIDEREKRIQAPDSGIDQVLHQARLRAVLVEMLLEWSGPFRPDVYERAISEAIATANAWIDVADTIRDIAEHVKESREEEHKRNEDGRCIDFCPACRKENELRLREVHAMVIRGERPPACTVCGAEKHPRRSRGASR